MRSVCLGLGLGLGDVGVVAVAVVVVVVAVVVVVVEFERPLEALFDLHGDDGADEGDARGLGRAPFAVGGVAMVRRKWRAMRCESWAAARGMGRRVSESAGGCE